MKISLHQAHTILGITQAAGEEEVRAAYRKLALRFHPDKNPSPEATAKFQELSAAYKRICDYRARQQRTGNQFRRGFEHGDDNISGDDDDDDGDLFGDDLDLDDLTEDDLVDLELSLEEMLSMFEMMFDPSTFDAPFGKRKGAVKTAKPKAKGKSVNGSSPSVDAPQQQQQRKAAASATGPRVALSRRRRKAPFMGGRTRGTDFASFMDDDMRVLEQFMAMSMDDDDLNQMESDLMEDMMQFFMGGDELPSRSRRRQSKAKTPSKVVDSDADSDVDEVEEVSDWEDDEQSAADETQSTINTSSTSSSSQSSTAKPPQLEVGARVRVFGSHAGVIKFVGRVHYSSGDFVGVALDDAVGKNDGTVKGVAYFSCPPLHGMMVRPTEVQLIAS
ncbi:hypothetical protein PINS_up016905 [Pythium insidiosum]|nr:hypothetical protein PINS_up016905 [Pythium insidiosum]